MTEQTQDDACRAEAIAYTDSLGVTDARERAQVICGYTRGYEAGRAAWRPREQQAGEPLYVIFDGPPSHESGRFVEVETADGRSVGKAQCGADWAQRPDGLWSLGPLNAALPPKVQDEARGPDAEAVELLRELVALDDKLRKHNDRHRDYEGAGELAERLALNRAIHDATASARAYLARLDAKELWK